MYAESGVFAEFNAYPGTEHPEIFDSVASIMQLTQLHGVDVFDAAADTKDHAPCKISCSLMSWPEACASGVLRK